MGGLFVFLFTGLSATANEADGIEFFEKKIRPVLAERCYECHSEGKKIKAGLRLDISEGWIVGGDSGPAILPGNVKESRFIRAIHYVDNEMEPMPPKSALPREEIALFEEWIRRGAPAPKTSMEKVEPKLSGLSITEGKKFWAFIAPTQPVTPPSPSQQARWPRTDIDRFIAAGWEEKKHAPTIDSDRRTLIRRAYFDLIGLPPAPDQIEAFVADARPDAFARVVDPLLASTHFGERWGRHWLDVARFAESSGGGRTLLFKEAWRYRDYVIDAFNRDLPFDHFIREQIAGDLLPHANIEERTRKLTATAFLALGPTNYEEQNKGALRMDIVDEQLDTIGKGFLGLTIGCARCHDHKFDPVPTRDYYALAGIFYSTRTLHNYTDNVARWVDVPLPLEPAAEQTLQTHRKKIAALEAKLKTLRATEKSNASASGDADLTHGKPLPIASLPGIVLDETKARVVGEWSPSTSGGRHIGEGYLQDRNEGKGAKTVTFSPTLPRSGRYEVRLAYPSAENHAPNVPITILHADGETTLKIDQRQRPPIGGRFISLGQFRFEQNGQGYVLISNEGTTGHVVVDALQLIPLEAPTENAPVATAKGSPGAASALKQLEAELRTLVARTPKRPQTMGVTEAEDIGDTEIRIRGNIRALGAKVPRGFLQVAMVEPAPAFSPKESGRLQLADWIASPANPLTARVIANRTWAWLLGAGLVRTVDNFGTTGEQPSHPALLDYLAQQFVAGGWSTKNLIRTIMLSRTYQLATTPTPGMAGADPDNRLLTHANRRRLDAEQIRDTILWTSGALDLALGGPNIGQGPQGAANLPVDAEYGYKFTDTRRSVYTPAFRNQRLELFEVFDFADVNAPIGQRNVSTVAPQALFLMNHPFVIAQAKLAAERALATTDRSDPTLIQEAYQLTLGRPPTRREHEIAREFITAGGGIGETTVTRADVWAQLYQALFSCVDFRYLN